MFLYSSRNERMKEHPEMFYKKGVLKFFAKLTGKHLCQSLFFNKVAGLSVQLFEKGTLTKMFFCEFSKISKNTFFTNDLLETVSVESHLSIYYYYHFQFFIFNITILNFSLLFFISFLVSF